LPSLTPTVADVPKRRRRTTAMSCPSPVPIVAVHRKLVFESSTATGDAVHRSEGCEALQFEQVGACVAALLAATAVLHFDHRESHATGGCCGHSNIAFDVQETHGPAPALPPGHPRPRRRQCLSEAGAHAGWSRRARRLVVRRSRVLPLAGEDCAEQTGEPRAGRGRPAAVAAVAGGGGERLPRPHRCTRRCQLLLLLGSHRGRPGAARGADGAEAAEGALDLGRREVPTAGQAVVRARRAVAGRQGGLVVVVVMQGRLLLLLGAPTRWCCRRSMAAGLLVQGVADGVQQRRREGRLARPPPRLFPHHRRRRPPLHCWRVVEKSTAACGAGQ
jgi:hypothetical protein